MGNAIACPIKYHNRYGENRYGEKKAEPIVAKIGDVEITLLQGSITQIKDIEVIVNPTNFKLEDNTEIAKALAEADPEWNSYQKLFLNREHNKDFREGGRRALGTPTYRLKTQNAFLIINVVGPNGQDTGWQQKLERTYRDTLIVATRSRLSSLIFPPISTGEFAKDSEGKVIITPTKAAHIAISTVDEFIRNYPTSPYLGRLSLKKIYFISRKEDGQEHFDAYQRALKNLSTTKDPSKFRIIDLFKKMKKWKAVLAVGAFATLASLYLLKKYYSSL